MAAIDLVNQSATQFRNLSPARQIALALTALGSLAFGLWIAIGAGSPHYRVLYRGLDEADAARVVEALSVERIGYRLEAGGTTVEVPAAQVHEARIRLAGRGLPGGAGAGFELFDEPRFGTTEFVHRVNYRRALQGELARSVEQLNAVERARVQIAIPKPSPFVGERERTPSASVVVRLAPGKELGPDRVRGIVHLVSSSVEALEPERVSVVDEAGRLLAPAGDAALGSTAPSARQRYQNALERELSSRVEAILGRTVGAERVVARVRADLEWTQAEQTEERFDPNSQIERSEQRSTELEAEGGGAGGGGRPGVASNVPDAGGGGNRGAPTAESNRTNETINYELSKTVRHSVEPLGGIKRLTLAVLVDGQPNAEGEFQSWGDESIQQFEQLARHAVGFSEERGDRITLTNAPFRSFSAEEEMSGGFSIPQGVAGIVQHAIRVLGLLVALFLFSRLVVKPITASLNARPTDMSDRIAALEEKLVASGAIAVASSGDATGASAMAPVHGLASPAIPQSDQSLQAIRTWLRES